MPLFEFQCEDCCATFERLVMSAQSNAAPDCPQCNGSNTSKQFSTFSTNRPSGTAGAMASSAPPAFT